MDSLPSDLSGLVDNCLTADQSVLFRYCDVEYIDSVKKAIETKNSKWILHYTRDDKTFDQSVYEKAYTKSCQVCNITLMAVFGSKLKHDKKFEMLTFKYLAKGRHYNVIRQIVIDQGGYTVQHLGFIYEGLIRAGNIKPIKSRLYLIPFGDDDDEKLYLFDDGAVEDVVCPKLSYSLGKHDNGDILNLLESEEKITFSVNMEQFYRGMLKSENDIDEKRFATYLDGLITDYNQGSLFVREESVRVLKCIWGNPKYHGVCEQKILGSDFLAQLYITELVKGERYQKIQSIVTNQKFTLMALKAAINKDNLTVFLKYFDKIHTAECIDYCVSNMSKGKVFETIAALGESILRNVVTKRFLGHLIRTNYSELFIKYFDPDIYNPHNAIIDALVQSSPLSLQWLFDNHPVSIIEKSKQDQRPVCDVDVAKILVAQIQEGLQITDFKRWIDCADFYDHYDVVAILKTAL